MKAYLILLACAAEASAQGIVTTVAGTDYIFPDDGRAALQAHLAGPSGVSADARGNIYIADNALNMILKVDPSGVVSILAGNGLRRFAGDGGPARASSVANPQDVTVDTAGNVYFSDSYNARVRKISPSGVITTVVGGGQIGFAGDGGPASQAQIAGYPTGVAVDRAGNLYFVDQNNSRVRKIDTKGIITTVAGNGQSAIGGDGGPAIQASLQIPLNVTVDAAGNIYISECCRVRKVTPAGTISTVAGGGSGSADNVPATQVNVANPAGLAVDASGNLYFAEQSGHRIRRVDPNGIITTVAGTGQSNYSGDGASPLLATFSRPTGIALDPSGSVLVADLDNARIRKVGAGNISTVAGAGAFTGDAGPAPAARLNFPQGVTLDAGGNLYIADQLNHRIRKVTPAGITSTVAGTGRAGYSPDGTQAAAAYISFPASVAIDPQGNLVFADSGNQRIRKVLPDGTVTTIAGTGNGNFSGDGGKATSAGVGFPDFLAYDSAGNLYYVDFANRVRKISTAGIITTVAGNGNTGYSGDGGPATSASFGAIRAVAIDSSNNLYIGDDGNHVVRKVNAAGIVATVAGSGGPSGANRSLSLILGVATDQKNNVYIAANSQVYRLDTAGNLNSYAGNHNGFSGDGGAALSAAFDSPSHMYLDAAGNLYVADSRNGRVRLIQVGAAPSIVASQKGLTFLASTGGGAPAQQSFTIVNGGQGTLNWGVAASTTSGGNWLGVTPSGGASPPGAAGPPVQVSVNPSGLGVGDYYGQIQIQGTGAPNSPQSVTVVLTVRTPGSGTGSIVQPAGLLFTNATPQSLTLSTLSTTPITFAGTASFGGATWFTLQGGSGSTVSGKPATVQIVPATSALAAGVYNANITFAFSDNSIQNVQLLLVVSTGGVTQPNAPGGRPAGCLPSKLLPLFTSLGAGFSLTTGWPSPIELRVVDDCGQPLVRGSVTVSFSNTDPTLTLNSLGDGRWTGTWLAQNAASSVSVTASAQAIDNSLTGSAQVSGGLNKNANPPPVVASGGVLNAASYQLNGSLAPGSLIAIFGSLLAQGTAQAQSLPLTNTLSGTTVTIAGRTLPLLYAGANQVNAMIPYDLPINALHQVVVQRGTALSNPEPVGVLSSQSGVFTKDLTGAGAGIVVRVTADGAQSVVSGDNPAHAYEALIIYCAGLGDVDPRQIAGQQTPLTPLSQTLDAVKVSIGGVDAPVFFAGLTPGFTGLYQVNAYVPTGVTPGDNVPLTVTQAGRSSPAVSISVR